MTNEQEVMMIEEQSESDDVDAIEKDLENTNVNVDKELKQMESELEGAY